MDKKLNFWAAAGLLVLYFVAVFVAEFAGLAHPVCWLLFPALGAMLAALPYYKLAARWKRFGMGTTLAATFALLMTAMGEMDFLQLAICVGCGLLSDVVRMRVKNDYVTYPILALGNMATILYLWTRKEWYLQGAAAEMGQAYADSLAPLQNVLWFCTALGALFLMAEVGLWIAKKLIKE